MQSEDINLKKQTRSLKMNAFVTIDHGLPCLTINLTTT